MFLSCHRHSFIFVEEMEDLEMSENSLNGLKDEMQPPELTYAKYLKLKEILSAQTLQSVEFNQPAHHEHLFIVIHQVFELWFKQILHELDSIMEIFKRFKVKDKNLSEVAKRLNRIILIIKLCIEQFQILETMTAADFLEFRNLLCSASGFQSLQFRLIEIKLGLKLDNRNAFQKSHLMQFWSQSTDSLLLEKANRELSFFQLIEMWLETYPFEMVSYERFQDVFNSMIYNSFEQEYKVLEASDGNSCSNKLTNLKKKEILFKSLFDRNSIVCDEERQHKLSQKALLGAMMISIYQAEPEFSAPYQILNSINDIDLYLVKWRYYHMIMVQKMIGIKNAGTGGSSGYAYLQSTICNEYQIFKDLANLPIFLITPYVLPPLSEMKIKNTE